MISDIRLQNFRIYSDAAFEFTDGVNIIVGPNGSGKTSLLEGIEYICSGKSHKTTAKDIIKHKKEWLRVETIARGGKRVAKVQITDGKVDKIFEENGDSVKRLSASQRLPVVIFEPKHLQILTESPSKRRDFIDDVIEQTDLTYEKICRDYKRVLAQRNALLKKQPSQEQLFIWDIRLSEFGNVIHTARQKFIEKNVKELARLYRKISKKTDKIDLRIERSFKGDDYTSSMLKSLKRDYQIDTLRGFTGVGPHRDNINLYINGHELGSTGSRGEIRTTLLALKILELKALEKARGTKPILLLDDVFSELDGSRRRALTDYLKDHQTFITTTDADVVIQHFIDDCNIIAL